MSHLNLFRGRCLLWRALQATLAPMRFLRAFVVAAVAVSSVAGEETASSSAEASPGVKTDADIPELKPLPWKHSGRKVHDPWKMYCGSIFCYDVLEVSNKATPEEIKKSYRKLSREWHPDKHPEKKVADVKFKLIARAYEVVGKGKTERENYDYMMAHPEVSLLGHFYFDAPPTLSALPSIAAINSQAYRKKHGEFFFKSLPPQTSVPVVLLLVLLVFSGIHFTILRHQQHEYNETAVKLCMENKGPREGGSKEIIQINRIAKERLEKGQIPEGAAAEIEQEMDFMDRIFIKFGYAPKTAVAPPIGLKKGKKGESLTVPPPPRLGSNYAAVALSLFAGKPMATGHFKAIIVELLKEENLWQNDPKIMDTLLFAGIKSAWFQISWILNHNVLGLPLSDDEKLYLLETTVDEWEDLSEKERDEVYARECWKKDALTQWRADFRKKKRS